MEESPIQSSCNKTAKEVYDLLSSICSSCPKIGCCPRCAVNNVQNILLKYRSPQSVEIAYNIYLQLCKELRIKNHKQ